MTYGMKVYEADGSVVFDTTSNLGVIHTTIATNAVNGSFTLPTSAGGTTVFAGISRLYYSSTYPCFPRVTVSGRTVTWTYYRQSHQVLANVNIIIGTM